MRYGNSCPLSTFWACQKTRHVHCVPLPFVSGVQYFPRNWVFPFFIGNQTPQPCLRQLKQSSYSLTSLSHPKDSPIQTLNVPSRKQKHVKLRRGKKKTTKLAFQYVSCFTKTCQIKRRKKNKNMSSSGILVSCFTLINNLFTLFHSQSTTKIVSCSQQSTTY